MNYEIKPKYRKRIKGLKRTFYIPHKKYIEMHFVNEEGDIVKENFKYKELELIS